MEKEFVIAPQSGEGPSKGSPDLRFVAREKKGEKGERYLHQNCPKPEKVLRRSDQLPDGKKKKKKKKNPPPFGYMRIRFFPPKMTVEGGGEKDTSLL